MAGIKSTDVLIIGAGPFGLSLSAYLRHLGIEHLVAGEVMSFWKEHMPAGMLLRSGADWHMDVLDEKTIAAFLAEKGIEANEEPLSRDTYLEYTDWFRARSGIEVLPLRVDRLEHVSRGFVAYCGASRVEARTVVVATGFRDFAFVPPDVASLLPEGRYGHSCEVVELKQFAGKAVLVIGGRQSAFEWAALLSEAGAAAVEVVYRHETPRFEASDWSWVDGLMECTATEPLWYRELGEDERRELNGRFWAEGRLKLEPWLRERIDKPGVRLWAQCSVAGSKVLPDGRMEVALDGGASVVADFAILCTGYRVDLDRLPWLGEELRAEIETRGGAPVLGGNLESSVEGLYFTSMAATGSFGPFFAFTVSARCSSRLIGDSLAVRLRDKRPTVG